jgi:hypothetical protein
MSLALFPLQIMYKKNLYAMLHGQITARFLVHHMISATNKQKAEIFP